MVALATAAIAAGADSFVAIGAWVADLPGYLLEEFGVARGAPSESTFRRVLGRLDADVLDPVLAAWAAARAPSRGPGRRFFAVDGKTLRGSAGTITDTDTDTSDTGTSDTSDTSGTTGAGAGSGAAVAVVAAVEHDTGAVLGQVRVCAGDEIGAVVPLLDALDITGVVITADALHTQRSHAAYLHRHGAHYLFTVKANQPKLYQVVSAVGFMAVDRDPRRRGRHREGPRQSRDPHPAGHDGAGGDRVPARQGGHAHRTYPHPAIRPPDGQVEGVNAGRVRDHRPDL